MTIRSIYHLCLLYTSQAPNSEWFNEYWQGINTDDIDFIPVHNYPGNIGVTDKEIDVYKRQVLLMQSMLKD